MKGKEKEGKEGVERKRERKEKGKRSKAEEDGGMIRLKCKRSTWLIKTRANRRPD